MTISDPFYTNSRCFSLSPKSRFARQRRWCARVVRLLPSPCLDFLDEFQDRRGLAVEIGIFLQRGLSLAGEKPVDEDPRGVRMRRAFDEAQRSAAARDVDALFPILGAELVNGKSLLLRFDRLAAAEANGKFPAREPVADLPPVAPEGHVHGAE